MNKTLTRRCLRADHEERHEYELLDSNESTTRDILPSQSSAALQSEERPLEVDVSTQIQRQTQGWQPFTTDGTVGTSCCAPRVHVEYKVGSCITRHGAGNMAHESTRGAGTVPEANPIAIDEEKQAAILGAMKNFSLEYAPQWAARLSDQQLVQTVDQMTSGSDSTQQNGQYQSS